MKEISLILPFKESFDFFENCLMSSLVKTTKNPSIIEVLVAVDSCDQITQARISEYEARYSDFGMKFFITSPTERFTKYYNLLAGCSSGRWIIPVNDDAEFITPGWDSIASGRLKQRASKFGDDIILGLTNDGLNRKGENPLYPHFTCWPVISVEHVRTLGHFFNEMFKVWGIDHFVADVYKLLGRRVSLTDVKIMHKSFHAGILPKRSNYERFKEIEERHGFAYEESHVREEASRLIEHLKLIHGKNYSPSLL